MLGKYKVLVINLVMAAIMAASLMGIFGPENPAPTEDQIGIAFDQMDAAVAGVWAIINSVIVAVKKFQAAQAAKKTEE